MRRSLVALTPAATALMLAACMGDRDTGASRLNAPQTSLASSGPNSCDFSTMKSERRPHSSTIESERPSTSDHSAGMRACAVADHVSKATLPVPRGGKN